MHAVLLTMLSFVLLFLVFGTDTVWCSRRDLGSSWQGAWRVLPTFGTWSVQKRIPMTIQTPNQRPYRRTDEPASDKSLALASVQENGFSDADAEEGRGKKYKKFKKYLLPLLLAYKLKFFTLIPILIGGLLLLTGATGMAGFFFALFAASMGLKGGGDH